jgi:hypothetical protein
MAHGRPVEGDAQIAGHRRGVADDPGVRGEQR